MRAIGTAAGAILKASFRDEASFITSPRRSIKARPAVPKEKIAAGLSASVDAVALVIRRCRDTIKLVVERRPLSEDVTASARLFATTFDRPYEEAYAAFTFFGMIPPDDLAELAHFAMAERSQCPACSCSGGYAAVLAALAQAAADAVNNPWTVTGIDEHFSQIKSAKADPTPTADPRLKAIANAIHQVTRAAGYDVPQFAVSQHPEGKI